MKNIYWIWLSSLSGHFSNKITALFEHFDTAEDIYNASIEDYKKVPGLTRSDALILSNKDLTHAEKIVNQCKDNDIKILVYDDINYPDMLRQIESPPYVLYVKGEIMNWDRLFTIGVVGTRSCTEYGVNIATGFSYAMARRGVTVVSGMARGIDSAAARGALKAGGKTIAVFGCGLDRCYPPENVKLMKQITENGAIISEYPPGTPPLGDHFPERNRIISGLSKGVLLIEAPEKSGALSTSRCALASGKDLFVVPGSIFSPTFAGSHQMLKEGGRIAVSANDVLMEYPKDLEKLTPPEKSDEASAINNIRRVSIDDEKYASLEENEKKIIGLLIEQNMHIEDIKDKTGFDMGVLNSTLPVLEMTGFIRKLPGDNYKLEI